MTNLKEYNRGLKIRGAGWFFYYNGLVYGNKNTDINTKITNKGNQVYR